MTNPLIPPLTPSFDEPADDRESSGVDAEFLADPLDSSQDEPLDPDLDDDQVDSAAADERAAAAGTKDGDVPV